MKFLFLTLFFLLALLNNAKAWELPGPTQVSGLRYLPKRQEVLVNTANGVWRFDTKARLIRRNSKSTQKLWIETQGKSPASLHKVDALMLETSGLVFIQNPHTQRVHVISLEE